MTIDASYRESDRLFRQMKPEIDAKYPAGRLVAMVSGRIIADAATIEELQESLASQGADRTDVFVARAGEDYPEYADILLL